jgi:hypothetical protein
MGDGCSMPDRKTVPEFSSGSISVTQNNPTTDHQSVNFRAGAPKEWSGAAA